MAWGQVFPQALRLSPVTIIPPVLHNHILLIYHHWYIILLKASLFLWGRPVVFYRWLLTSYKTAEHRKNWRWLFRVETCSLSTRHCFTINYSRVLQRHYLSNAQLNKAFLFLLPFVRYETRLTISRVVFACSVLCRLRARQSCRRSCRTILAIPQPHQILPNREWIRFYKGCK